MGSHDGRRQTPGRRGAPKRRLDGGRQRVHPSGAAAGLILLLVFTAIGFLAGWITGTWLT
ncbi:MAG: hypothetical protein M5T61_21600 [Acidimicrobiia bacterium]|nr:hypothetical protein [Acidimicrobiia bacterium]